MARNLIKGGHSVVAYDVNAASIAAVGAFWGVVISICFNCSSAPRSIAGAKAAKTPAEVAAQCQVVITMLPSSPHVQEVYLGDHGILSSLQKGSLCIDSSTIDPTVARTVAKAVEEVGPLF